MLLSIDVQIYHFSKDKLHLFAALVARPCCCMSRAGSIVETFPSIHWRAVPDPGL